MALFRPFGERGSNTSCPAIPDLEVIDALRVTADDTLLPLRETTRGSTASVNVVGRACDLNADGDRRN
jgi:hypothetical protein